ncbi:CLUMA_CG013361, isoform A [Clunio marinus]|uniref:CLUMA_CG013361, isoform A n=1 Tax=Clunio marinus TaxID=568069 RepID=A0A1J1IIL7_9DIPT|nr:CLUMA_CG013361, isoform A [Clunio marinus]
MEEEISVHPLSHNPTEAWKEISKSQRVIKIAYRAPRTENSDPTKIRIVAMSDTHALTRHLKFDVPDGDIFIHAGDFTACGSLNEVKEFNQWLGDLPHKHKLVIAGNHELSFDPTFTHPLAKNSKGHHSRQGLFDEIPLLGHNKEILEDAVNTKNIQQVLTNCTYLEDSGVELYGLKFWGTPHQPEFCHWAFNLKRGEEILQKWNLIPSDTDILITHTPPVGFNDLCCNGIRAGCVELLTTVQKRVKPLYHIFGHIHESRGISSDGKIVYINASTCDISYLPQNPPIVFDCAIKSL